VVFPASAAYEDATRDPQISFCLSNPTLGRIRININTELAAVKFLSGTGHCTTPPLPSYRDTDIKLIY
jgi:hypothetical protein